MNRLGAEAAIAFFVLAFFFKHLFIQEKLAFCLSAPFVLLEHCVLSVAAWFKTVFSVTLMGNHRGTSCLCSQWCSVFNTRDTSSPETTRFFENRLSKRHLKIRTDQTHEATSMQSHARANMQQHQRVLQSLRESPMCANARCRSGAGGWYSFVTLCSCVGGLQGHHICQWMKELRDALKHLGCAT